MGVARSLGSCFNWNAFKDECLSIEQLAEFVQFNFDIDLDDVVTCLHCERVFDVSRTLLVAINHLRNNHAGYIIKVGA